MSQQVHRRKRGVILTPQGFQKLQTARSEAEMERNAGHRYTLESLNALTGLSVDSLMKVFKCEVGVDKETLKSCFRTFDLVLEADDFVFLKSQENEGADTIKDLEPEIPGGQVPLNSKFYVERLAIEADCYKTIRQPGALIRIKAPRRMGKTSLMARILNYVKKQGYQTVPLSFQLADKTVFQDLDRFLRWFCVSVGLGLQLPDNSANYWNEILGSKISCKVYFERYLLFKTTNPVVLGLDDIDYLFEYPALADEFFALLRTWYEDAKNREIWKKLRLVLAHSTEIYIPLNLNKSPFNVGLPIELQAFTTEQVQDLAKRYGFNWLVQEAEQLTALVGGQPYLVQIALYHIWHQDITVEQLLQTATSPTGIYRDHLQRQLNNLKQDQDLLTAFAKVLETSSPVTLDLVQALKLQSIGLVSLQGNQAISSCNLYRQYFWSIG